MLIIVFTILFATTAYIKSESIDDIAFTPNIILPPPSSGFPETTNETELIPVLPYTELYERGKSAYLEEHWFDCVAYLLSSIDHYRLYRARLVACRRLCQRTYESLVEDEDLRFYEQSVRSTLCLLRCKRDNLIYRTDLLSTREMEDAFEKRAPYEYLHLCYYKIGSLDRAAASAFTFLLLNPEHEVMRNNLQFYLKLPNVSEDNLEDLNQLPYQDFFKRGIEAYSAESYDSVIGHMEKSLSSYLSAEEDCRFLCEGKFETGPMLDLIVNIGNHFTFTLRCKQRCADRLSYIDGDKHDDLLATYYHYLQYAYSQTEQLEESCRAVASYLLIHPDDEVMLYNKDYYSQLPNVKPEMFAPREEAATYVDRDSQEKSLLGYIEAEFVGLAELRTDSELPTIEELTGVPSPVVDSAQQNFTDVIRETRHEKPLLSRTKTITPTALIKNNETIGFTADSVLTPEECGSLITLTQKFTNSEDPTLDFHRSPAERVSAVSFHRIRQLMNFGLINRASVQYLAEAAYHAKQLVVRFFNSSYSEVYYDGVQLRTARQKNKGILPLRQVWDMSVPFHADGVGSGSHRNYSAVIYLNEDFQGGAFVLGDSLKNISSETKPACGRIVAFRSTAEYGIRAVTSGKQYTLWLWYSHDSMQVGPDSNIDHWEFTENESPTFFQPKDEL